MLIVPAAITAMAVATAMTRLVMRPMMTVMPVTAMLGVMRQRSEGDECRQRRDIGMIVARVRRCAGHGQRQHPGNRDDAKPVYT